MNKKLEIIVGVAGAGLACWGLYDLFAPDGTGTSLVQKMYQGVVNHVDLCSPGNCYVDLLYAKGKLAFGGLGVAYALLSNQKNSKKKE
ncbi:MAG: hypothetical protein WCV90_05720 [Candidatus Woesearchaeota archaeon]|jgi:hypothetical protein